MLRCVDTRIYTSRWVMQNRATLGLSVALLLVSTVAITRENQAAPPPPDPIGRTGDAAPPAPEMAPASKVMYAPSDRYPSYGESLTTMEILVALSSVALI